MEDLKTELEKLDADCLEAFKKSLLVLGPVSEAQMSELLIEFNSFKKASDLLETVIASKK